MKTMHCRHLLTASLLWGTLSGPLHGQIAGSVDPTFNSSLSSNVYTLAIQPDGRFLVGGGFHTTVDGHDSTFISRLLADGSLESTATFNPGWGTNSPVTCLSLQADGKLLIGGGFAN